MPRQLSTGEEMQAQQKSRHVHVEAGNTAKQSSRSEAPHIPQRDSEAPAKRRMARYVAAQQRRCCSMRNNARVVAAATAGTGKPNSSERGWQDRLPKDGQRIHARFRASSEYATLITHRWQVRREEYTVESDSTRRLLQLKYSLRLALVIYKRKESE